MLSICLGLLLAACGGGGSSPAPGNPSLPPVATTQPAGTVTTTGAVLNGTVNPNGLETTVHFEWGTDPTLAGADNTTGQSIGTGSSAVDVNAALTGLTDNSTYYYRVVGTNSAGTSPGDIASFTTLVPAPQWERTFGGDNNDVGRFVRQTSDGGFIIAGTTASFGAGDNDVYLIKTNASGDNTWTKRFGGAVYDDQGSAVRQTSDGGFIIAGTTATFGAGSDDVYLIKTDTSGDNTWSKTFGGADSDRGHSVQQTSDGGYIIAGSTISFGPGLCALYLIKTDASGNVVWDNALGEGTWQEGHSVQQTSDGGYIIAGFVRSSGNFDVYLVKTDASGNVAWTKRFGGAGNDYGYSVQQTADGGYVIAGSTNSFGAGSDDVFLIKTNASGDNTWTRTFGGTGSDAASSVQQTSDGGYVIAGITNSFGAGSDDVYLIRTDASGSAVWIKTLGGTGSDQGRSVQQTPDGGYVVTGSTEVAGSRNVYLIKLD